MSSNIETVKRIVSSMTSRYIMRHGSGIVETSGDGLTLVAVRRSFLTGTMPSLQLFYPDTYKPNELENAVFVLFERCFTKVLPFILRGCLWQ